MVDIWDMIIEFNDEYFPNWRRGEEIFYSNALAGEAGEFCNKIKKRYGGGIVSGTKKGKFSDYELMIELADLFIYMELWIESKGHDISTFANIIVDKLNQNIKMMESNKRKRP